MNGREVFRCAVGELAGAALTVLDKAGYGPGDLDWLVPHQANRRIIDAVGKRLRLPADKVIVTVERHANTSAASIPLALNEAVRGRPDPAGRPRRRQRHGRRVHLGGGADPLVMPPARCDAEPLTELFVRLAFSLRAARAEGSVPWQARRSPGPSSPKRSTRRSACRAASPPTWSTRSSTRSRRSLLKDGSVKISSFGTFAVRQKGHRIGRNPKTGEEVPILPRRVLVFRASQVLKERINDGAPKRS